MSQSMQFQVQGMTCVSCQTRLEKVLNRVPGVTGAQVNFASEIATVQGDFTEVAVVKVIENAGFSAVALAPQFAQADDSVALEHSAALAVTEPFVTEPSATALAAIKPSATPPELTKPSSAAHAIKQHFSLLFSQPLWPVVASLTLAAILALPMLAMIFGKDWMLPAFYQWVLATPVQFYFGRKFYRAAWSALKARTGNMDLLVALGTSAAYGLSVYNWLFRGDSHLAAHAQLDLYFESSSMVIALILLGKYLEHSAKIKTTDALKALAALRPATARVQRSGQWQQVPLAMLQLDERVQVLPGERIPVDGLVVEGQSHVDEALITGESLPLAKEIGSRTVGGSINLDGMLVVQTTALGADSMLAKIMQQVENSQNAKPPIQALVDRISAIFVPVVCILAILTLLGWGLTVGDWQAAIIHAVSVLVIACPCALGLATPTAIMAGTGAAAKWGILIQDMAALERAKTITMVVFDKTGTLTQGKPAMRQIQVMADSDNPLSEQECLAIAASLATHSEHPLAKALVQAANSHPVDNQAQTRFEISDFRSVAGRGIAAQIAAKRYVLGSSHWLQELGATLPPDVDLAKVGGSISWLGELRQTAEIVSVRLLASMVFDDPVKATASAAIANLRQQGVQVVMLSGDNPSSANRIAQQLGLHQVHANMLPQDKTNFIRQAQQQGHKVAMVGDGINDAPALAQADLGIAIGTGTDVAMQAAAISILQGDPKTVPIALQLAQQIQRKIQQNLFWAFIFNTIGIPAAAFGLLSPVLAGGAMAFSSLFVVSNALLLQKFKP